MCVRVNAAAMFAVSLLVSATLAASAEAEEESTRSEPMPGYEWLLRGVSDRNWQPSLAVTSGVTFQRHQADVSSSIDDGFGDPLEPLRDPASGEGWRVSPNVGINAEVMTPELWPGGSSIRIFVNGEYLPSFGADLDVAKAGDPKGLVLPQAGYFLQRFCDPNASPPGSPFGPGCNCPYGFGCFPEEAITGVGSRTTANIGQDVFGAAIGVAVPFEFLGRRFLLKPSFGWIRYDIDVDGTVLRAMKFPHDTGPGSLPRIRPVPVIRVVELRDTATQAFNAIGPGLELEMEVHQAGPVETSLFLDARGYRVLGNREIKLSDSTTASCPGPVIIEPPPGFDPGIVNFFCNLSSQFGSEPGNYSADWSYKLDPWLYRVGLGLRFRWTGEK